MKWSVKSHSLIYRWYMTPLRFSLSPLPLSCHLAPCNVPDTKHSPIPALPHQSIAPLVRAIASFPDAPLLPPSVLRSGSISINDHCGGRVSVSPCHTHHADLLRHLFASFIPHRTVHGLRVHALCDLFETLTKHYSYRTSGARWEQRASSWEMNPSFFRLRLVEFRHLHGNFCPRRFQGFDD